MNNPATQLLINSTSRSKYEQIKQTRRSSSKLSGKNINIITNNNNNTANTNNTKTSTTNNGSGLYNVHVSPSSASINSTRGISAIGNGLSSTNGLSGLSALSSSTYVSPSKMAMTTPNPTTTTAGMSSTTTGRTTISK